MRAFRSGPPAARARSDEFAAQWAVVRDMEATLRLRRHGDTEERPAPPAAIVAVPGDATELFNRTSQELAKVTQELSELRKQNLKVQEMCLQLQSQNAAMLRQNARLKKQLGSIFRLVGCQFHHQVFPDTIGSSSPPILTSVCAARRIRGRIRGRKAGGN
jgi:small-conductance mechanosensitive channel